MRNPSKPQTGRDPGFTLIELLVVMTIIGILLGIGNSLFRASDGPRLQSATRIGLAGFDQARATAIAKGRPVRILVHIDPGDIERCYRVVRFVAEAEGSDPDEERWETYTADVFLPDGIYFDRASVDRGAVIPETMEFDPTTGLAGSGTGQLYYVYEFGSVGSCSQNGSRFILAGGSLNDDGTLEQVPGQRDGFVITGVGRAVRFRSPDQI